MPTTYAHDLFGKCVYQKLDKELQGMIDRHEALFRIGLHGPDILFYYEPFHKNQVKDLGSKLHHSIAAPFFIEGKRQYKLTKSEDLLVYLLGFACHYMLDSTCHPYIREYIADGRATHDETETDLDRFLMEKTHKDPFSYRAGCAIHPSERAVRVISFMIPEVEEKKLMKALKSMRIYTAVTVGSETYRKLLLKLMKLIHVYDFAQGRVMRDRHLASCEESTRELVRRFGSVISETAAVLTEYVSTLDDVENINERFQRDYE